MDESNKIVSIKCPNCGAPYNKSFPRGITYLTCSYCGTVFLAPHLAFIEKPLKQFDLNNFYDFLVKKKGIKYPFDTISRSLTIGDQTIIINEDGTVSGPENIRKLVEKWINEYFEST
jgi:ribosomal protein S27AE